MKTVMVRSTKDSTMTTMVIPPVKGIAMTTAHPLIPEHLNHATTRMKIAMARLMKRWRCLTGTLMLTMMVMGHPFWLLFRTAGSQQDMLPITSTAMTVPLLFDQTEWKFAAQVSMKTVTI